MANINLNDLRQSAVAGDVPTFLDLVSSETYKVLFKTKPGNQFRGLQRQGYNALVLAALSKGLQLLNSAAAAAWYSSPGLPAQHMQLQQLKDSVTSLATAATNIVVACSVQWGAGSPENMEQELLDSGANSFQSMQIYKVWHRSQKAQQRAW